MAPEYGATCGFFPVDAETINYLRFTGRDPERCELVEAYAKEQGLWREKGHEPVFTDTLTLDLGDVVPSLAGPKRPQDKIALTDAAPAFLKYVTEEGGSLPAGEDGEAAPAAKQEVDPAARYEVAGADFTLGHGDVVIAAITSCTNTSNPSVMLGAGLLARKAVEKGLAVKPWVKTSLAPGSQVVTDYLARAGLQEYLDQLGFDLVGYGCTTCIGNSGPLRDNIREAIESNTLTVAGVLSGNRNFEGRIHPYVKANYLASPPLVVAYALAGNMGIDITKEPLGTGKDGKPVYLKDIWPTSQEVSDALKSAVTPEMFRSRYSNVFEGPKEWSGMKGANGSETYHWDAGSTYVKNPPFFANMNAKPGDIADITGARCLALLGDSVTTDHISPAGSIQKQSPAGQYLIENGVAPADFNSYGSRRGNHEVMMRGTFANIRIRNEMVPGVEGGMTKFIPTGEQMPIYDAAMKYEQAGTPLVIVAGKEYGTGSSRDWAAKGTRLLGVRAVVTESYERIHRSNLIGMGVLPLQFKEGATRRTLGLTGDETFDVTGVAGFKPGGDVTLTIHRADGSKDEVKVVVRIDTLDELEYYKNGGILHYVLRNMAA
jgi:aconitate hydratase